MNQKIAKSKQTMNEKGNRIANKAAHFVKKNKNAIAKTMSNGAERTLWSVGARDPNWWSCRCHCHCHCDCR